jgi:hypothetical protein
MAEQVRWSRAKILDAIELWVKENGQPPKLADWRYVNHPYPSAYTVADHFGTFGAALTEAGYYSKRGRRPNKVPTLDEMKSLAYEAGVPDGVLESVLPTVEERRGSSIQWRRRAVETLVKQATPSPLRNLLYAILFLESKTAYIDSPLVATRSWRDERRHKDRDGVNDQA